ncbi:MAG: DUF3800 domain-containing protein [Acidimicrobiia bacterium]|nr:DUF3800 domain-containing protein [Acidimicrobiia bacterium]MYC58350.1 DUF3800 domain-containing protein [Acidimicrobiia bacterium]MYG93525.1 DUF3800 domain-containing protein [Acidimicrobiia bacterium]MYI29943.1 DUF3800 domain-containing protein [Acidimicrobiia bacterium]
MLLCYLDESGNTGSRLDDPYQPYHYLVAVMVREDKVSQLSKLLDELAAGAATTAKLVEYHGQELFSGSGPWNGVESHARISEYEKALTVITEVDAYIAHASISKPDLAQRGPWASPHLYALQFLTEKIDGWIASNSDPLCRRGLLVADQNHQEEQYAVELVREMQKSGGPIGSVFGIARTTEHIVDNVYFVPSERNRGIQLADLVAFIINRRDRCLDSNDNRPSAREIQRLYMRWICPRVVTWRDRWPS